MSPWASSGARRVCSNCSGRYSLCRRGSLRGQTALSIAGLLFRRADSSCHRSFFAPPELHTGGDAFVSMCRRAPLRAVRASLQHRGEFLLLCVVGHIHHVVGCFFVPPGLHTGGDAFASMCRRAPHRAVGVSLQRRALFYFFVSSDTFIMSLGASLCRRALSAQAMPGGRHQGFQNDGRLTMQAVHTDACGLPPSVRPCRRWSASPSRERSHSDR